MTCSHRLRGLPSSAGSPSLLHLRALAPQRHIVSSWQGTVEPQPPPHASSVVAWAHCQARILRWPTNALSHRHVTWSESLPSSYGDRLIQRPPNSAKSRIENITVREDRSYHQTTTEQLTMPSYVRDASPLSS